MAQVDIASSGAYEMRFVSGEPPSFSFYYHYVDMSPAGVWAAIFDVGNEVYIQTSAGLTMKVGARYPKLWGGMRWLPFTEEFWAFRTFSVGTSGGQLIRISRDGHNIVGDSFYDVDPSKSPDILDIAEDGSILWWQDVHAANPTIDGISVTNPITRGGLTVCSSGSDGKLGLGFASWDGTQWRKVFTGDVQWPPKVANNWTVAVVAPNGGFFPPSTHVPFNPRIDPPPDPDEPDEPDEPDPDEPEPTPMPQHSMIEVESKWVEVVEDKHQDATKGLGPIISVKRVSDGHSLQADGNGHLGWTTNNPGAWERAISVPGAYVVGENRNAVVKKAGPWPQ